MTLPGIVIRLIRGVMPAILAGMTLSACVNDPEPAGGHIAPGDPLPAFSVTLDDGTRLDTRTLGSRTLVLEFFNTSCPDCRDSFGTLQTVWEAFADDPDVVVAAVARDEDAASIGSYWRAHALTIPWSAQPDRSVYLLFASSGIPRLYIAHNGVVTAAFGDSAFPDADTILGLIRQP